MIVLNTLNRQELFEYAEKNNIPTSSTLTQQELIKLIQSHMDSKQSKITLPTKEINSTFDNNITVLFQSNHKVLIIWSSDPIKDNLIKAWKIQNNSGLDILIPNYSRSVFLDISSFTTLDFALLKVNLDDSKELYQTYSQELSQGHLDNPVQQAMFDPKNVSKESLTPYIDKHLSIYKTINTASENHFDIK